MADDVFGELGAFDQRVKIDPGLDADLVAHKHQILGAHIAGGAFVTGEWTFCGELKACVYWIIRLRG